MGKRFYQLVYITLCGIFLYPSKQHFHELITIEDGNDGYDAAWELGLLEIQKTKDPSLGYVPVERLWNALRYTDNLKQENNYRALSVFWTDRGPTYDSVGPSNGNLRAGHNYTSGRIRSFLIDISDPSGNTVFCGGVAGGLWKCTNFLSAIPNWQSVDDFLDNMAITSICQDPSNPDIMYFATGEASSNGDAVFGRGVWKSFNHGATWSQLPSTTTYFRTFKIVCDATGKIYLAARTTNSPLPLQPNGLLRSTNGGISWTNITPSDLTSNSNCTDIEISGSGRLHASFGYNGNISNYRYTDIPSSVTSVSGWKSAAGLTTTANRIELACQGDTLYAAPTNSSNDVVTCWRSVNGGANWIQTNTEDFSPSPTSSQGWYDLSLAINPLNPEEIIIGGLDAYRSLNGGQTISRLTYWVGAIGPYVHADHHDVKYISIGSELRILMATDGGLFLSRDAGMTFVDKNRNLSIKQFYSCAIHPTLTYYLLAGAQDNGSHQLKNPGLSYSIEVTGGDGAYVHIDQNEPQYQFTSYLFNQYRRSTNGGNSWTSFNLSGSQGMAINPFDYDDLRNIMYCSNGNNAMRRWNNPQTAVSTATAEQTTLTLTALGGSASALKVSPHTADRVFIGSSSGRLLRIDNVDTLTQATVSSRVTDITGPSFAGFLNCVAVGSDDSHLLAVFTNYGVNNVWSTVNGGVSWTGIDGTAGIGGLPDMPVRWAVFSPSDNNKAILATDAGVYTTNFINGASTQWLPSPGFPLVRTDMLKIRNTDNTIVAATHGRGLLTGNVIAILPIKMVMLEGNLQSDGRSLLKWSTVDETTQTHYHLQYSTDGITFTEIADLVYNVKQYRHDLRSKVSYYRVMATEPGQAPVFSNTVLIRTNKQIKGLQLRVIPNPITTAGSFIISNSEGGTYTWQLMNAAGQIINSGKEKLVPGGSRHHPINTTSLPAGLYRIRVVQEKEIVLTSFIKQ